MWSQDYYSVEMRKRLATDYIFSQCVTTKRSYPNPAIPQHLFCSVESAQIIDNVGIQCSQGRFEDQHNFQLNEQLSNQTLKQIHDIWLIIYTTATAYPNAHCHVYGKFMTYTSPGMLMWVDLICTSSAASIVNPSNPSRRQHVAARGEYKRTRVSRWSAQFVNGTIGNYKA